MVDDHAERAGGLRYSDQAHQANRRDRHPARFAEASGLLFEQAMAQTRMAVCLTDPSQSDQPIVFCNQAFEELTGYTRDEIIGRNCRFLQGPATDPREVEKIRQALRDESVVVVELLNYRKDGTSFWNTLHLGPIYEEGRLKYFFGSQWDVTNIYQSRAEERHAKAMAREVSHRLKNVFSVIGGIVNVTGRAMDARDVARRINERVQALGRSYEPTLDDAILGQINVGQSIRTVLGAYDRADGQIIFAGEDLHAEPNAISAIGLTLHELATNAVKYGALSVPGGTVTVRWSCEDDEDTAMLVLTWQEQGGPRIDPDAERAGGTGFEIAETLLRYSRGTLSSEWAEEGLRAEVRLPLLKRNAN